MDSWFNEVGDESIKTSIGEIESGEFGMGWADSNTYARGLRTSSAQPQPSGERVVISTKLDFQINPYQPLSIEYKIDIDIISVAKPEIKKGMPWYGG